MLPDDKRLRIGPCGNRAKASNPQSPSRLQLHLRPDKYWRAIKRRRPTNTPLCVLAPLRETKKQIARKTAKTQRAFDSESPSRWPLCRQGCRRSSGVAVLIRAVCSSSGCLACFKCACPARVAVWMRSDRYTGQAGRCSSTKALIISGEFTCALFAYYYCRLVASSCFC